MKNGINILILFFSFLGFTNAQIQIEFSSSGTPTPGQTFNVDVGVSNFNDILSNQYWIKWDSTVLAFNGVNNVTLDLDGFDNNSFSTPFTTQSGKDGVIGVSWYDSDSEAPFGILPDDTRLFSIVFDVVGEPCDSTALTVEDFDIFQLIEVIDPDFNEIGLTFDALPVKIPGSDCSDEPPVEICGIENDNAEVTLFADATIEGAPGDIVCVPIQANDFNGITSLQGGIAFDSTLLRFTGVQNLNLPLPFTAGNISQPHTDSLTFIWFDNSGMTPHTAPNGTTLFEVCFEILGEIGDCAFIEILDVGNSIIDISDSSGALEYETICGKVTVAEPVDESLTISAGDVTAEHGDEICVPITADNFEDILSFQYSMTWDTDVLNYTGLKNISQELPLFEGGNISYTAPNTLTVSWNSSNGECMSFPDGTLLYELGFTVDCSGSGTVGNIQFVETPSEYEVTDCDAMVINSQFVDGSVTCGDPPPCNLSVALTPSSVDCFGDETGNITVQATDGVGPFICMWEDEDSNTVGNSNCQLLNVPVGSYCVTITDSENCTAEACTIINGPALALDFSSSNATDADCTTGGTVSVNVVGGTGSYTYNWDNGLSNQSAHNNLSAAEYCVTVLDENDCEISTCLTVNGSSDVTVTAVVTDLTCDSQGAIDITATGSNLCYDWDDIDGNNNVEDRIGLDCGEYTVTVKETTTGCTTTATYEVVCMIPDVSISIETQNIDCDNTAGSIIATCTGGCPNTEYECLVDGIVFPCDDISGLSEGSYTFCKREVGNPDNTTCENFDIGNDVTPLVINSVTGVDVSCAGAIDGTIMSDVSGGCGDYTCFVNSEEVDCDNMTLGAGSYQFCIMDDSETICWPDSIIIGSPDPISISITEIDLGGGLFTLDATVSGGTGMLSYEWFDEDMMSLGVFTEDLENVGPGTYTLVVTDENECTESITYSISTEVTVTGVVVISEAEFNGFGVSCFASCDGMVAADIMGIAPFSILIADSNGDTVTVSSVFPIEGLCAGEYTMTVTDNTLTVSDPQTFIVTEPTQLLATLGTVVCESAPGMSDGSIQMNVTGGVTPYTYNWNPAGPDGPTNTNLPGGLYTLEILDDNGCDWITAQEIEVMVCDSIVPCYEANTVITPDGDSFNEFFTISCILNGIHTRSQLDLYDRYGRKVNGFSNYTNTWNGLDDTGTALTEGAYYWVLEVEFQNGAKELFKGVVTLLRD